jgi:dipeptidyl aminopeptidase/acylaminoacyl peptidase
MILETADVSGLPKDIVWPEPVMLKAEDGQTDIHGIVFRPSNFDSEKVYPVLDCTTGYSSPVGAFTNAHAAYFHLAFWAYAELGFIVVVIFNRGSERLRDKAFNEYVDPALPADPCHLNAMYNNDCVAGIKQLAERFPNMDINRVGVVDFGHSPRAVAGMLLHPDFYKVGVSVNADIDRRIKSSMGMDFRDEAPMQLVDLASRLEGKLLIIANLLDRTVPVSMSLRLVDALHKANKRFDMLLLPEEGHSVMQNPNTVLRCWDYLVEHLMGIEPPKDFSD